MRRHFEPVRKRLQSEFGMYLREPCFLVPAPGVRGFDRFYYVEVKGKRIALMRVKNALRDAEFSSKGHSVFWTLNATERLDYEWSCYTRLAQKNLSPRPLWRSPEVTVSAYYPYQRASEILRENPEQVWLLLPRLFSLIREMHAEKQVHMDLNLGNILVDPQTLACLVIDFEFVPAEGLSFEAACLFDYCRVLSDLLLPHYCGVVLEHSEQKFLEILRNEVPRSIVEGIRTVQRPPFKGRYIQKAETVLKRLAEV